MKGIVGNRVILVNMVALMIAAASAELEPGFVDLQDFDPMVEG